jgi:hypothetical protein
LDRGANLFHKVLNFRRAAYELSGKILKPTLGVRCEQSSNVVGEPTRSDFGDYYPDEPQPK